MKYLLLCLFLLAFVFLNAQCPRLSGVMINSCGTTEGDNEFFTLRTYSPIDDITAIRIRYGTDATFATRLSISGNTPNIWVANPTYLAMLNAQITVPGCQCVGVNAANNPDIPANKDVVIFSNSVNFNTYNLSSLCASSSNNILVMFFDPTLATGAGSIAGFNATGNFGNYQSVSQLRFFDFTIAGTRGCTTLK